MNYVYTKFPKPTCTSESRNLIHIVNGEELKKNFITFQNGHGMKGLHPVTQIQIGHEAHGNKGKRTNKSLEDCSRTSYLELISEDSSQDEYLEIQEQLETRVCCLVGQDKDNDGTGSW